MYLALKHCGGCGRLLPLTDFQRRKEAGDARQTRCRDCRREYRHWNRRLRGRKARRSSTSQAKRHRNEAMLAEFLGTILDEVGGVAGLYALVYEYGERLRRDPARVAEAANFYAGIFRILARS